MRRSTAMIMENVAEMVVPDLTLAVIIVIAVHTKIAATSVLPIPQQNATYLDGAVLGISIKIKHPTDKQQIFVNY
jgi:hypothetical protein